MLQHAAAAAAAAQVLVLNVMQEDAVASVQLMSAALITARK